MMLWAWIFLSVLLVSLLSLISIFFLSFKKEFLHKLMAFLISFAAGALLGDAFLHLLPEAVEEAGFTLSLSLTLLAGIIIFFILEKFIHWRHCHIPASKEHPHPFAWMNLLGDALHNFMDGLIIAGSYLTSIPLGVSTTLAVVLHEIPQEMGDFSVLLKGGFTKSKALLYNFLTALSALLGALLVFIVGNVPSLVDAIVPFTAGGFIYIATADLIPELHKETLPTKSLVQLFGFVVGIVIMFALLFLE